MKHKVDHWVPTAARKQIINKCTYETNKMKHSQKKDTLSCYNKRNHKLLYCSEVSIFSSYGRDSN